MSAVYPTSFASRHLNEAQTIWQYESRVAWANCRPPEFKNCIASSKVHSLQWLFKSSFACVLLPLVPSNSCHFLKLKLFRFETWRRLESSAMFSWWTRVKRCGAGVFSTASRLRWWLQIPVSHLCLGMAHWVPLALGSLGNFHRERKRNMCNSISFTFVHFSSEALLLKDRQMFFFCFCQAHLWYLDALLWGRCA